MNNKNTKMFFKTRKSYEYNGDKTKITESSEMMPGRQKRKDLTRKKVTEITNTTFTEGPTTTTTTNTTVTSFYRSCIEASGTQKRTEITSKFKDGTYNTIMVTMNDELKLHRIKKYDKNGALEHEFDVLNKTLTNNHNIRLGDTRKSIHSIDDSGLETITYYENDRIMSVYKSFDKDNRAFIKSESYEYDNKGRQTLFKNHVSGEMIETKYVQFPNGTVMSTEKSILGRHRQDRSKFTIVLDFDSDNNDPNRFSVVDTKYTIKVSVYDERKNRVIMSHVKKYSDVTFSECIEEYIEHFEYERIIDIDGNMYDIEKRIISRSNGVVYMRFSKKSDTIDIVSVKHYSNGVLKDYFQTKTVSEAPSQDGTPGRVLSESSISRYF